MHKFRVIDEDGTWGHIASREKKVSVAKEKVRAHLKENEVWPRGSLLGKFQLRKVRK